MTLACLGHWYLSLLYLVPVVAVMGGLSVVSRVEKRREKRESAAPSEGLAGQTQR
ncbi:MAG: hypothetical protein QOF04_2070 [Solirubrobacteraceae bacterium]|nr:hypothetical protein [Solirubrobacteraceae bacterium]